MDYSYKDVFSNPNDFDQASAFWENVARQALSGRPETEKWHPWFNRGFANGTLDRSEGTPMTSYISWVRQRGFKIEQFGPGHGPTEFCADVRVFGRGDPDETPYLAVMALMSSRSAKRVQALIEAWLMPDMTPEMMQELIRRRRIGFRVKRIRSSNKSSMA